MREQFTLTTAERPVVALVAQGLSNNEIGRALHLAPDTVKGHLHRIGRRTGASNREAIIGCALRAGLFVRREPRLSRPVTPRKREILSKIAYGMGTDEIARELALSANTIKTHIRQMLELFKARNRAHLLRLAFDAGALDVAPHRSSERAA